MKHEHKSYILQNQGKLSISEIARHLQIKERKVKKFLDTEKGKHSKSKEHESFDVDSKPTFQYLISGIMVVLGFLIYSNILHANFQLDDLQSIVNNFQIRNIFSPRNIWLAGASRFLTNFTFALNYHFGELNVIGYHVTNIFLHIATSFMIFRFAKLVFQTPRLKNEIYAQHAVLLGALAGFVFLTHPIQTQAVTYIVQRASVLAALFYISTCVFFIKSRVAHSRFYYALALSTMAGALFTKPIVFTLPFTLLLIDLLFLDPPKAGEKNRFLLLAPFFLTLAVVPFLLSQEFKSENIFALTAETEKISRGDYLLTQFNVIRTYIRLLFLPVNQNFDYVYPVSHHLLEPPTFLSFLLSCVILGTAFQIRTRRPLIAFGIFWFYLTLSVESSIIPIRDVIFEHRLYLPMAGFSLFVVALIYLMIKNIRQAAIIILVIVVIFSGLTFRRNFVWADSIRLWQDVVNKSPQKARAYHQLGMSYDAKGDLDQAIEEFKKAIEISPKHVSSYYNLAMELKKKGNYDQAFHYLNQSAAIRPDFAQTFGGLGTLYFEQKNYEKAIQNFEKSIHLDPKYLDGHYNLAIAYQGAGRANEALKEIEAVRSLGRPDLATELESGKGSQSASESGSDQVSEERAGYKVTTSDKPFDQR